MNAPDFPEIETDPDTGQRAADVVCAAWLDADTFLAFLDASFEDGSALPVTFGSEEQVEGMEPLEFVNRSEAHAGARFSHALVLPLKSAETWPCGATLRIETGAGTLVLDAADMAARTVPLKTVVREFLAGMESAVRHEFSQFLCSALREASQGSRVLHESLHAIREALRERLPSTIISPDQPLVLAVDGLLAIDEVTFYIEGWMRGIDSAPSRLTVVSPEGERVEILGTVTRYARPDLHAFDDPTLLADCEEKHGFLALFELRTPSRLNSAWVVELENGHGDAVEATAPPLIRNLDIIRERLLRDVGRDDPFDRHLFTKHISPALQRIQQLHAKRLIVERVLDFGPQPSDPDVSIIIPIYKRIDLIEHQFAQFVHDPELRNVELIYVLDSPEDSEWFLNVAGPYHELYRINFRAVLMKRNGGFSAANNAGIGHARGRLLLLLNSDVLPAAPGWLGKLIDFHDANPSLGAVGPKLLYEDDSIQHAGLYFSRADERAPWNNEHYFKGMHRSLPAANIARTVPAVTAAALMIARDLYLQIGGLRGSYVQGDFEDSDLCLRLWEAGREVWYCPEVELYHLEGQSYPSAMREVTGRFNAWLHTHLCSTQILRTVKRFSRNVFTP